jgi:hypothetical protein
VIRFRGKTPKAADFRPTTRRANVSRQHSKRFVVEKENKPEALDADV